MIIDSDKLSVSRHNPVPQTHDNIAIGASSAKGTNSTNYVTPATNQSSILAGKNGQLTIVQKGTVTPDSASVTFSGGTISHGQATLATVPHGLNFTPGIVAYFQIAGTSQYNLMPTTIYGGFNNSAFWIDVRATVDNTNVYVIADIMGFNEGPGLGTGYKVIYYLTQQTSN